MIGSTDFIDEIDCGSFFDHIDDLLDFPNDDVDAGLSASDSAIAAAAFSSIWTTQSESLPCSDSIFSNNTASDLSAELSIPYEDIVQLEWLSNFVEDSNCGASLTIKKQEPSSINKDSSSHHDDHQFKSSSPISVLESSSPCSREKLLSESVEVVPGSRGRLHSKRPCPSTSNPKVMSDSESYVECRLLIKLPRQVDPEHKKKKIKLTLPKPPTDHNDTQDQSTQTIRKCMHCEITKTPQWRAGPMGPKTLCNACGVRFKSGRLFPEYRPAASPTFIPALHSNSHKKVLEMRTKIGTDDGATITKMVVSPFDMSPISKENDIGSFGGTIRKSKKYLKGFQLDYIGKV